MIRGDKVRAVARFELLGVVRKWSWVLSTFGLPVLLSTLSGGLLAMQGQFLRDQMERVSVYGVVDEGGTLDRDGDVFAPASALPELPDDHRRALTDAGLSLDRPAITLSSVVFLRYADEAAMLDDLRARRIEGGYVLPADYVARGRVRALSPRGGPVLSVRRSTVEPVLGELLTDRLLSGRVDEEVARRVRSPLTVERASVADDGAVTKAGPRSAEQLVRLAVPFLLGVLLLTALLSASGYLVQAVAQDKESKVVEVLLSSATPDELLTGKLLGLGAAGLLQFFVWSGMVVGAATMAASALSSLDVAVPWAAIALSPVLFVLGYLFVGSLMLATGSLGGSVPESQKLTLGWAALSVLPLMVMLILLEEPHGPVGQVLTYIPFSAPLTVIVRLSVDPDGIAAWEIALSLLVLLVSTRLSIGVGARLFRVGLLLTGSRPSWREVWRQARL